MVCLDGSEHSRPADAYLECAAPSSEGILVKEGARGGRSVVLRRRPKLRALAARNTDGAPAAASPATLGLCNGVSMVDARNGEALLPLEDVACNSTGFPSRLRREKEGRRIAILLTDGAAVSELLDVAHSGCGTPIRSAPAAARDTAFLLLTRRPPREGSGLLV